MPRRRTSRLQGHHGFACQICKDAIGPHIKTARTPWVRMSNLGGRHGSACGKRHASSCEAADGDFVLAFNPNLRAPSVCGRIRGQPEGKRMRDRPVRCLCARSTGECAQRLARDLRPHMEDCARARLVGRLARRRDENVAKVLPAEGHCRHPAHGKLPLAEHLGFG